MSQNYNIAGLGQFLSVDQVANTISINSVSVALSTVNSTSNGVFIGNNVVQIGNTSIYANLTPTTLYIGGNVIANSTGSNNAFNLGGTAASGYQTTAGLSANVATLTANNTSFVGSVSAANVVSNAQLSSNLANYQTTAGLSANVATLTANNTSFVGSVSAANVVSNAQLSSNLANYQTTAGLNANIASYLPTYSGVVNASSLTTGATGTGTGGLIANVTTLFVGNNTINTSLTTTGLNINAVTIANTTGVYTGIVNGSTISVGSSFTANSTLVNAVSLTTSTNTVTIGTASYFVANGNLGVGTSSPAVSLQIGNTSAAADRTVRVTNSNMPVGFDMLVSSGGAGGYLWVRDNSFMSLGTNNAERMRIDSSGNVGIGTSSPSALLDVQGSNSYTRIKATGGDYALLDIDSPASKQPILRFLANGVEQARILSPANEGASQLAFTTGSSTTERMRIDSSGNVGIGTSSPGSKLDVAGTITIKESGKAYNLLVSSSSTAYSGYLATYNSSGTRIGYLGYWDGTNLTGAWTDGTAPLLFGTNGSERMRINSSGQVLINATSPHTVPGTNQTEVNGGLWSVVTTGQAAIGLYNTTSAHVGLYMFEASGYSGLATIDNAGGYTSNPMNFVANGNVGVSTSAPGYSLDVNGTIHYTTLTASSDRRFKKNITPITGALDSIKKINPIRFEWNEFVNERRSGYELGKPTFGVFAQDVKNVFPELVTEWKLSDDCQDALSVNYEKLVPVLLAAIQELSTKIEDLKIEINSLKGVN